MAGGKILVGGTAYDVTEGKTLVGGTAYDINAGETLIGGTSENIVFSKEVTLRDILYDMTDCVNASRNSSSRSTVETDTLNHDSVPELSYVFSFFNGYLGIFRINRSTSGGSSTFSGATINRLSTSYGAYGSNNVSVTRRITFSYSHTGSSATSVYGASFMLVTFPNYSESEIDAALSNATLTRIAGRNSSSRAQITTSSKTHAFYLAARCMDRGGLDNTGGSGTAALDIWECDGSTWTLLKRVTPSYTASAVNGSNLETTLSSKGVYAASIVAMD